MSTRKPKAKRAPAVPTTVSIPVDELQRIVELTVRAQHEVIQAAPRAIPFEGMGTAAAAVQAWDTIRLVQSEVCRWLRGAS